MADRADRRARTATVIQRRLRILASWHSAPTIAGAHELAKWTKCRCGKRGMCSLRDHPLRIGDRRQLLKGIGDYA